MELVAVCLLGLLSLVSGVFVYRTPEPQLAKLQNTSHEKTFHRQVVKS